jgi:hypothetical protein
MCEAHAPNQRVFGSGSPGENSGEIHLGRWLTLPHFLSSGFSQISSGHFGATRRGKDSLVRDVFTLIELADYPRDCKGGGFFRYRFY